MFVGLGVSNAQNPLYDTTKVGHNIKRVVLYDYTVTGGHGASRAVLRLSLRRLAIKYGFKLDTLNTAASMTAAALAPAQILMTSNGDGDVFSASGAKTAVTNFVEQQGHAVFMIHASAAFIPCPTLTGTAATNGGEDIDKPNCQFLARVAVRQYLNHDGTTFYGRVYVDSATPGQVEKTGLPAKANCTSNGYGANIPAQTTPRSHGIKNSETKGIFLNPNNTTKMARSWESMKDEWYTFRSATYWPVRATEGRTYTGFIEGTTAYTSWEGPVNVLLSYDEWAGRGTSATAAPGTSATSCPVTGDHPLAWTRKMGKGISAYNSIGHDAPNDGGVDIYLQRSNNAIAASTTNPEDSVVQTFNWNTMRYLAGDFTGCMDPNYAEYNAEATVSLLTGKDTADWNTYKAAHVETQAPNWPVACKTQTTAINVVKSNSLFGITSARNSIQVSINQTGAYRVLVTDMKGRQVFSQTATGGLNKKVDVSNLQMGTYFVRVNTPKSGTITKRISIY